jgi:diaminopimelate decarboxylase
LVTAVEREGAVAVPQRVLEVARRLGADLPAYVYDLGALDAHAAAIRAALPREVEFYYAVKANPDAAMLRTIARHADGFEVSSAGELRHMAASVPGRALAFGGPGKTAAELAAALQAGMGRAGMGRTGMGRTGTARAGMGRFHVESPHELGLLAAAARAAGARADILLRVNLAEECAGLVDGAALVMGGMAGPFGLDMTSLGRCAELLARPEYGPLRLRGLHAHLASGLDAGPLLALAGRVLAFGRDWCARQAVTRPEFNLGGGMAVDYRRPEATFDWAGYGCGLAALARPGERLRIEPGRAVTAYCGWYLTRVLDVKRSGGEAFAVVAGGTHHLRTPAARGHDQPFAVIPVGAWPHPWERPGVAGEAVTLVGQLCTPKDVLARRVAAERLRAGDLVVFGLAGAYAWNISHHGFLMHPPPSFHYLA